MLRFHSDKKNSFNVGVVVGLNRSGKTLIGSLIDTFDGSCHIDEPWTGMMLPVAQHFNLIKRDYARDMMAAYAGDLFNELVLLRGANLRPNDCSSVWKTTAPEEIFYRLGVLRTHSDAQSFVNKKGGLLLLNLEAMLPFLDFIELVFMSSKKIIMVRNPFVVAGLIEEKGWLSDKYLGDPCLSDGLLYRKFHYKKNNKVMSIPWWVAELECERFLALNEFSRALYYWSNIYSMRQDVNKEILAGKTCMTIKYEDLIANKSEVLETLLALFDAKPTAMTAKRLSEIIPQKHNVKKKYNLFNDMEENLHKLMIKFGY